MEKLVDTISDTFIETLKGKEIDNNNSSDKYDDL